MEPDAGDPDTVTAILLFNSIEREKQKKVQTF